MRNDRKASMLQAVVAVIPSYSKVFGPLGDHGVGVRTPVCPICTPAVASGNIRSTRDPHHVPTASGFLGLTNPRYSAKLGTK